MSLSPSKWIARCNSNRESAGVKGQKVRQHQVYVSPLVHRLNQRCQELFGSVEKVNYRPPVPPGDEHIGLEYLFAQSSDSFSAPEHYAHTRETLHVDEDDDEASPNQPDESLCGGCVWPKSALQRVGTQGGE